MAHFDPINIIQRLRGKVNRNSDFWFKYNSATGKQYTGSRVHPRNYNEHPVTEEERKTTSRLAEASQAYNSLVPGSPEYVQLHKDFEAQLSAPNRKPTFRGYFISRYMAQLKSEGTLAADSSHNLQNWSLRPRSRY